MLTRQGIKQELIPINPNKDPKTVTGTGRVKGRGAARLWAAGALCTIFLTASVAGANPWTVKAKPVAPEPIPGPAGTEYNPPDEEGTTGKTEAGRTGKTKARQTAGTGTATTAATATTSQPTQAEATQAPSEQTSRLMDMIGIENRDQGQPADSSDHGAPSPIIYGASSILGPPVLQAPGEEGEGADQTPSLATYLGTLSWGDSSAVLVNKFERALWVEYDQIRVTLPNVEDIDHLRSQTIAEVESIKSNHLKFEQGRTEYRASIIDGKFARGTGEAVIRIDNPESQTYYFFVADKLWKMIVAFNINVAKEAPFNGFVKEIAALHGKPVTANYRDSTQKRRILADVIWRDGVTELKLENKAELFGTYTLELTDQGWAERIIALRNRLSRESSRSMAGTKGGRGGREPETPRRTMTETMMEEATSTEGYQAAPEDIVDQLIRGAQQN